LNGAVHVTPQVVKWLSCLSRSRYAFVVAGILEKVPCTPGPKEQCRVDGLKIYSTTVVFGKNGQVEAKYEIINLICLLYDNKII